MAWLFMNQLKGKQLLIKGNKSAKSKSMDDGDLMLLSDNK